MSHATFPLRLLAVFAASLAVAAHAQVPAARLTSIFPPGVTAGRSVEVTAAGTELDDATLRFSHPGLVARPLEGPASSTERKFTVTASPDVPPGVYEARVAGRQGVSNPRAFCVGSGAEVVATANTSPAKAMPLAPGVTADARCTANAADFYALSLHQNRRTLIECATRTIDSRLNPVLLLSDEAGREVARARRGGLIDFTAPANGTYTLQVHDLTYRGGPDYFYRLCASSALHLDCVFPPAGAAGSKGQYTLYGRNLPGGTPSKLLGPDGAPLEQLSVEIELPTDPASPPRRDAADLLGTEGASVDAVAYRLRTPQGDSNPVLLAIAPAPLVAEKEPNDSAPQAQKLTLPCEVAGRFYPRDDADAYTFDAAKGDAYWIEVTSDRLGPPTSPSLLVQKVTRTPRGEEQIADVQELGGPDATGAKSAATDIIRTAGRDISYRLEAKEAGTYRLVLRDLFNTSHDDASLVYRLSIRRPDPDFRVLAAPAAALNANNVAVIAPAFLRKGGVVALQVSLLRRDGFNGPVTIEANGLPPGLTCLPVVIPAGDAAGLLLIRADDSAKAWAGGVRITATADLAGSPRVREARVAAIVWEASAASGQTAAQPAQARLTDEMALAFNPDETEPLTIAPAGPLYEVKAGGKVQIPLKLTRHGEIKAAYKLKAAGLTALAAVKEVSVDPKADSAALDLDLAQLKLPPGTYTFCVQTQATVKYEKMEAADPKAAKGAEAGKAKKIAKDVAALFFSSPITLKVSAGDAKKS